MTLIHKLSQSIENKPREQSLELDEQLCDTTQSITKPRVICLGLLLVASSVVVHLGRDIVSQVASLYSPNIAAHPYFFHSADAVLLYVLTPLVVLSGLTLILLPGIFLVLAMGKASRLTEMIIQAFGTSFIAYLFLISLVKLISPVPANSSTFLAAVSIGGALAWTILAYRVFQGEKLPWPISHRRDIRRLLWTIAIPLLVLLLMLPIIFWQDMHDDGFEVFEIGRSLSSHFLPRFPNSTGFTGLGQGMLPMAYPVHWFIVLFGSVEASARLPMLLYLPLVFCLLLELIEWHSSRFMGFMEEALLCLALGIYTVTMCYNASYDPYFADIAAPAAAETLTVLFMLATIYFLWSGQIGWFFFCALMSYLCRPTGLLLIGLLGFSTIFIRDYRKPWMMRIFVAVGLCVLVTLIYQKIYVPSVVDSAGSGIPFSGLLRRFRFLKLDDFSRINYALFPSGILPFISLLAIRWQDSMARTITITSLSYFLFFFFPAFIALHHFVPVMILPLVVFWRIYLNQQGKFRRVSLPALALTGILAFWLSLPRHFEINRKVRAIGQKTAFLVGDYDTNFREQLRHAELLFELIPPDWKVKNPSTELVSGYGSIIYYSTRPKPLNMQVNYIIQPLDDQAPPGFTEAAGDAVASLYVKDFEQWHQDRFRPQRTDYRSPLYDIPRTTLFRHWGEPKGVYSVDLKRLPLIANLWNIATNR